MLDSGAIDASLRALSSAPCRTSSLTATSRGYSSLHTRRRLRLLARSRLETPGLGAHSRATRPALWGRVASPARRADGIEQAAGAGRGRGGPRSRGGAPTSVSPLGELHYQVDNRRNRSSYGHDAFAERLQIRLPGLRVGRRFVARSTQDGSFRSCATGGSPKGGWALAVARIGQRSFGTKEIGDLADLVVRGGPHVLSLWPAVSLVAKAAGRAPSREERESCGRSLGDTSPSAVLVADGRSWVNPSFLSCLGASTLAQPARSTKRLAATSRAKVNCHLRPPMEYGERSLSPPHPRDTTPSAPRRLRSTTRATEVRSTRYERPKTGEFETRCKPRAHTGKAGG
jgi:hypothetical protein